MVALWIADEETASLRVANNHLPLVTLAFGKAGRTRFGAAR
jgi:hypothetical protein